MNPLSPKRSNMKYYSVTYNLSSWVSKDYWSYMER